MTFVEKRAGWRGLIGVLGAGLLVGCGGGGGGGSSDSRVTAVFDPPALSVSTIEGFQAAASFTATVNAGGRETLFLALDETRNLVVDGDANISGDTLSVSLTMSSTLPAGIYSSDIQLLACADAECTQQLPGSPMRLPLRYEVLPQIKIQAPAEMRRTGQAAAPTQSLPVSIPAAAGAVSVNIQGDMQAFGVELQGDRLVVRTQQLPSGTYAIRAELQGSTDPRYRASIELSYVVEPPAGGELPLRITPTSFDMNVVQGTQSTHRFKVDRPTWTDVLDPLTIQRSDGGIVRNLRPLGNDEYEFTVDASNLPQGAPPNSGQSGYFSTILVRAGDYGGQLGLPITVSVNAPLSLGNPSLDVEVSATTTATDLLRSTTVVVADGAAVRWSASSDQPWLRLLRSTGLTGVDELQYQIDTSVLALPGVLHVAQLSVSIDRPGTLPVTANVGVSNYLARFDMAAPGVLTGGTAKVYLHGSIRTEGGLLRAGVLSVNGAVLRSASLEEDTRFVGSVALLAVEIDGIVPGRAVTITAASPLRPASVTLPSVGALRVPAGYAPLAYGRYRPPTFAPGSSALVFSGVDTVWRWSFAAGAWQAPQQQSVPGVIDAAMAPNESDVFAIVPNAVLALDPTTLALRRQGVLSSPFKQVAFDPAGSAGGALRFAADGRAFASLHPSDPTRVGDHGFGWISGCSPLDGSFVSDLTVEPCPPDPGTGNLSDTISSLRGTAIVGSANGGTLAMSFPSGRTALYRGLRQQAVASETLPAGVSLVSVDDRGTWSVGDDGILRLTGNPMSVDLRTRVGTGFSAGGYAISGGGEFVVVYAYRIASEATGPRARDARLLLFDIRNGLADLIANPSAAAQIDLQDAVGCTTALATGETCEHRASVFVAQGDKSLFVVGPRAVAAAPLPITLPFSGARTRPAGLFRIAPRAR